MALSIRLRGNTWHVRGTVFVNGKPYPVPEFSTRYRDEPEARRFIAEWESRRHAEILREIREIERASDRLKSSGKSAVLPPWATQLWRDARYRATKQQVEFTLSEDDMVFLVARANGRCELSNIAFSGAKAGRAFRRPYLASIDRIDAFGGYTRANCRLVNCAINTAMNEWGENTFLRIAEGAVRTMRSRIKSRRSAHALPTPSCPSGPLPSLPVTEGSPETEADGGRDRD